MEKLFLYHSKNISRECVKWTFSLLCSLWNVKDEIIYSEEEFKTILQADKPAIYYCDIGETNSFSSEKTVKIIHSGFLNKDYWDKAIFQRDFENLPLEPSLKIEDGLPFPYFTEAGFSDKKIIRSDLFSSVFFLVNRFEEYFIEQRDEHGRIMSGQCWMGKHNLLHRPLVNEYADSLFELLSEIYHISLSWKTKFRTLLTHDIDILNKYTLRSFIGNAVRFKDVRKHFDYAAGKCPDPFNNIEEIIETEKRYGYKSVFLFLSGGRHKLDRSYDIASESCRAAGEIIKKNNCRFGLHGSYSSMDIMNYKNIRCLESEKKLMREALGLPDIDFIRMHYLRFVMPHTWLRQNELFKYDLTAGFADKTGFRSGICTPFKPFVLLTDKPELDIVEIPLSIMDATLKFYEKLSPDAAMEKIKTTINTVEKHCGVFNLLWHNTSFDTEVWDGWEKMYEQILNLLAEKGSVDFLLNI